MGALREGLPGWRGVKTLGPGSRSSNKVGGAELRPRGLWKGSRTHATAAPGCLGPWDMAAPGRTWNADAWLSKGRPGHRHHRARSAWGGRIPGLGRPPGRAPQGSFVGRSAPARPWSSPPGRQAAPSRSRDPRTAGPSQGPEFRSCFHLQRNFPGPLGGGASPTNRPEPAPAVRPAPPRPRQADGGLHARLDWVAPFPWGVAMQMRVGAPVRDWLGRPLSREGGGEGGSGLCVKFGCARPLGG